MHERYLSVITMFFDDGTKLAQPTRRMVTRLAWSVCLGLAGCLLPPPVEEIPAPVNEAPMIEYDNLSPSPADGVQVYSTRCRSYRLFGELTDPNTTDTLYVRVFIDYAIDPRPETTEIIELLPQTGITSRFFEFEIDPLNERFRGLGPHTVELFVADRPFFDDERVPKGRAVPDGALMDTHTWAVELVDVDDSQCTQPR